MNRAESEELTRALRRARGLDSGRAKPTAAAEIPMLDLRIACAPDRDLALRKNMEAEEQRARLQHAEARDRRERELHAAVAAIEEWRAEHLRAGDWPPPDPPDRLVNALRLALAGEYGRSPARSRALAVLSALAPIALDGFASGTPPSASSLAGATVVRPIARDPTKPQT